VAVIWLAYLALAIATAFWLRHRFAFFQRLNDAHWQALTLLDIAAAFVIFWPLFLVGLLRERPLPWATISAMCGCYAKQNIGWAVVASAAIDALFFAVTSQAGHSFKAFSKWASPLEGSHAG
jgi:hypothetical protein